MPCSSTTSKVSRIEQWDQPSLCDAWAVRDVIGHILVGNEIVLWRLPFGLARYGFSIDRFGAAKAKSRAAGQSHEELLRDFATRDRWAGTCRVFPHVAVLLDRLVHQQDEQRAIGHPRDIPEDALRACLDEALTLGAPYGTKKRVSGLRFIADDIDWSWGEGPEVVGNGEALLMALVGRRDGIRPISPARVWSRSALAECPAHAASL